MNYTQSDIAALKAADVLQAFISQHEDYKGMKNGKPSFTCRIHAHKHPDKAHIRLEEHKGKAVAICDSYGVIGDIFNVCREYTGESDFRKQVEAVAAAVGYNLTPDDGTALKKGRRSRKAGFSRPLPVPARPIPDTPAVEPLEYLPLDMEREAFSMVERLRSTPAAISHYSDFLGIPRDVIKSHTDMELAGRGLLGLDSFGRLVYIFTHCPDDSTVRVLTWKARNAPGNEKRFDAAKGHPISTMWGADDIEGRHEVIITEGESDTLAVRAAMDAWHDIAAWNIDQYDPDTFPAVVAKSCAGHFRPHWVPMLKNKNVTLLIDNDAPGINGAKKTASILKAGGVRRVFYWTSLQGKDARAALDAAMPHLLATDIYANRKEISQIELEQNGQTTK